MDVKILHMISGARKAKGLAVIIDVFRAFSMECYLMASGVNTILPVGDKEVAYKMKEDNPEYILIGERHGQILEGFDYGNSPSQIENIDFSGKTVIHTTSAGTQGISNASIADEIITGSLVNAKAVASYIKHNNIQQVSLVCMGEEAIRQTDEDNLCAKYIKSLLEGEEIDIEKEVEELKYTSGKKFFDSALKDIFPKRDFYLCTKVNEFDFVLKVQKDTNGINYIRKIKV